MDEWMDVKGKTLGSSSNSEEVPFRTRFWFINKLRNFNFVIHFNMLLWSKVWMDEWMKKWM